MMQTFIDHAHTLDAAALMERQAALTEWLQRDVASGCRFGLYADNGVPWAAVGCDYDNPCSADGCDPQSGCVHVANTLSCDDDNACTSGD